jgi:flavin-dependent dehydrogenase
VHLLGFIGESMEKYEVVVVGAGPGGLTAAKSLAESGKLAAKDILGQDIRDEMGELMEWRKGWNSIDLLLIYYRPLPGAIKRRVTKMVMDHGAPFVFSHKLVLNIGYHFLNKKLFEGGPK